MQVTIQTSRGEVTLSPGDRHPDTGDVLGDNGHFLTTCGGCNATDDHPKVLFGDLERRHHDCLSNGALLALTRDEHPRSQAIAFAAETAASGIRGQALREVIAEHHELTINPALEQLHADLAAKMQPRLASDATFTPEA